ncbi:MAG: mechanosensitive ion channel family protein, partial [Candidatus Promineifilaceae bacterium]
MQVPEFQAPEPELIEAWFQRLRELIVNDGWRFVSGLLILVIGLWLAWLASRLLRSSLGRSNLDVTLATFFSRIAYYAMIAIVVVTTLAHLGVPTASMIAVLGGLTLALGLALKDSIGHIAAGVLIILLRPYRLGDWVKIDDVEGQVSEIRLFMTSLTTNDNVRVHIPNQEVMSGKIFNFSQLGLMRLDLTLAIAHEADLQAAREIIADVMAEEERIAAQPKPSVAVRDVTDSAVQLAVRPYVTADDSVRVTFALMEEIRRRFEAEGIP